MDLEDELSKRKITYNQEPESCKSMVSVFKPKGNVCII